MLLRIIIYIYILIYIIQYNFIYILSTGLEHGNWKKYMDREYMRYYTFPKAGRIAGNKGNILEIGCEGYNGDDYKMCGVTTDHFYFVDVFPRTQWGDKHGIILQMKFSEMANFTKYHNFFDVIIDYGTLGYAGTMWRDLFTDEEVIRHINAYKILLKQEGILLLKWDFGPFIISKNQKVFFKKWISLLKNTLILVHEYLQISIHIPDKFRLDLLQYLETEKFPFRVTHTHYKGNFTGYDHEALLYMEFINPLNFSTFY